MRKGKENSTLGHQNWEATVLANSNDVSSARKVLGALSSASTCPSHWIRIASKGLAASKPKSSAQTLSVGCAAGFCTWISKP